MNPYDRFAAAGEGHRLFFEELRQWHDEMVLHQRHVRRVGAGAACSEECPHAAGRRLWTQAEALLGPDASALTFLRRCAGPAPRGRDESAASRAGRVQVVA